MAALGNQVLVRSGQFYQQRRYEALLAHQTFAVRRKNLHWHTLQNINALQFYKMCAVKAIVKLEL